MTLWFGASWGAPICDPDRHTNTPVGDECDWCHELVENEDQGVIQWLVTDPKHGRRIAYHLNCWLRQVVGSVGHQLRRCSCYVKEGDTWDDPPGMTPREAADAAVRLFETGSV